MRRLAQREAIVQHIGLTFTYAKRLVRLTRDLPRVTPIGKVMPLDRRRAARG